MLVNLLENTVNNLGDTVNILENAVNILPRAQGDRGGWRELNAVKYELRPLSAINKKNNNKDNNSNE